MSAKDEERLQLLEDVLRRIETMTPEQREEMARRIADELLAGVPVHRTEQEPDTAADDTNRRF